MPLQSLNDKLASGNSDNNGTTVVDTAIHPGEDSVFNGTFGGARVKKVSLTADGQIGVAGPCLFYGYQVTSALSANTINIRDAVAAATGDIVDIIAASAAAGVTHIYPFGVLCPTGAYADFGGTGTVTFFYWQ